MPKFIVPGKMRTTFGSIVKHYPKNPCNRYTSYVKNSACVNCGHAKHEHKPFKKVEEHAGEEVK